MSSGRNISRAPSTRPCASLRCPPPISARPMNGNSALYRRRRASSTTPYEAPTRQRRRLPRVLGEQSILDRELDVGAAQLALGAHRADRRCGTAVDSAWIKRLAQEVSSKAPPPGETRKIPALRAGDFTALTTLGLPDHAAQHAYWFSRLGLHLERADNTAPRPRREVPPCCCPRRSMSAVPSDSHQRSSILRSISALTAYHWVYRETLKPWLIAEPCYPQTTRCAVAGKLLQQSGAQSRPDRRRLWPPGRRPAPRRRRPQPAGTRHMNDIFGAASCMNSFRNSSRTTPSSVKSSEPSEQDLI